MLFSTHLGSRFARTREFGPHRRAHFRESYGRLLSFGTARAPALEHFINVLVNLSTGLMAAPSIHPQFVILFAEVSNMSTKLVQLSNALTQSTDHAASVVAVHTETRGSSSGVVWRPRVLVTAEHALRRDEESQLALPIGQVVAAAVADRDPSTDIAVLKCAEAAPAVNEFGDVTSLNQGSLTLVVGRTRASGPVAGFPEVSLVVGSATPGRVLPLLRMCGSISACSSPPQAEW